MYCRPFKTHPCASFRALGNPFSATMYTRSYSPQSTPQSPKPCTSLELRISEKKYVLAGSNLRKALSLVSQNNSPARAEYNKDLGRVYLAMNKLDSALLYTNVALQNGYLDEPACNILKGNIYLKMHRLEDAEQLFMKYIGKLPLNERHDIYYKMSLLKKEQGDFQSACKYAEKSIRTRDSLEANNKAGYISNLNAFQEHERQQKRIAQMNAELSEQELSYYRLAILLSFILLLVITGFFHINQKKKKTEVKYLKEKRDREAIEIESLNQSVEYYRRLNALTVPILMKSQNSQGAMHLKKEEWDIIVQNTDACFNDFTMRLKNAYPELTVEEIRFACLLKMEFSLSLLSEIYHIAKGSISRKKMRLKEKMKIENMTLVHKTILKATSALYLERSRRIVVTQRHCRFMRSYIIPLNPVLIARRGQDAVCEDRILVC